MIFENRYKLLKINNFKLSKTLSKIYIVIIDFTIT